MNHHYNPPPILHHQTTTQILRQTAVLFYSHLLTFLLLSTLVLIFRFNVHTAYHYSSALVDRDLSYKSTPSRIDFSDAAARQTHHHRHRRRPASLQLSRAGTLDDDFFSDSDFDRSLFHPSSRKPTPNATVVILSDFNPSYGFSDVIMDNGVSFPSIVKPGAFGFNPKLKENVTFFEEEDEEMEIEFVDTISEDDNSVLDLDFLIKEFELRHQDPPSLFSLFAVLYAAYAYSVFAFTVAYSCANGIIFLKVVRHLLGNHSPLLETFWEGADIGFPRLWIFILMKWAVREALAQIMGLYFFVEIEDQYVSFKAFLRIMYMPFYNPAPWVKGHEWESSGFIVVWFLIDLLVGLLFSVVSGAAIADSERGGWEIIGDGWRLLVTLFSPAFEIRWLEAIVCGSIGRWVLKRVMGGVYTWEAMMFQSLMEVYFMVAWLVFYFAAREMNDAALGKAFGRVELEALLDIDR